MSRHRQDLRRVSSENLSFVFARGHSSYYPGYNLLLGFLLSLQPPPPRFFGSLSPSHTQTVRTGLRLFTLTLYPGLSARSIPLHNAQNSLSRSRRARHVRHPATTTRTGEGRVGRERESTTRHVHSTWTRTRKEIIEESPRGSLSTRLTAIYKYSRNIENKLDRSP